MPRRYPAEVRQQVIELAVVLNQVVPKQLIETSNWRAMTEGAVLSVVVVAIEPTGELAATLG
jgi:Na+/H+-dicarboxylate symporter